MKMKVFMLTDGTTVADCESISIGSQNVVINGGEIVLPHAHNTIIIGWEDEDASVPD